MVNEVIEQIRASLQEMKVGALRPDLAERREDLVQCLEEIDKNLAALGKKAQEQALEKARMVAGATWATAAPDREVDAMALNKLIDRILNEGT